MTYRLISATLFFLLASTGYAQAASVCTERDSMISKLKKTYGETERGMGLSGSKAMIELWSSEETGTFTIVMTSPDGMSCVVAAGNSWIEALPETGPET